MYDEPKRTAIVRSTLPSTTQRTVLLDLSTHIARPVVQRGSRGAFVEVLPGSLLASSSAVGIRVMPCNRFSVRWSTSPVTAIWRFSWKPLIAAVVLGP